MCSNGLRVLGNGVTVSPGLVVAAGGATITDSSRMTGGALSITSTATSGALLESYSTLAGFTGDTILGRFDPSASGTAMNLLVGTTTKFQVWPPIGIMFVTCTGHLCNVPFVSHAGSREWSD